MKTLLMTVASILVAGSMAQATCEGALKDHLTDYEKALEGAKQKCLDYINPPGEKVPFTVSLKCGPARAVALQKVTEAKRATCSSKCEGPVVESDACKQNVGMTRLLKALKDL